MNVIAIATKVMVMYSIILYKFSGRGRYLSNGTRLGVGGAAMKPIVSVQLHVSVCDSLFPLMMFLQSLENTSAAT